MKAKNMNLNDIDLWERIIYDLNGTCKTIAEALDDNEALDLEDYEPFLSHLDNQIFRCECCNWWCDLSEMADDDSWNCRDCSPDENE